MDSFLKKQGYSEPIIIAELGAKNASLDIMAKMVHEARKCGADLVKFQTYRADTISSKDCFFDLPDGSRISQYEYFKKYELSREDHIFLDTCCKKAGIGWLSTPSHPTDVDLLETFNPPFYKTGSDDLTNLAFLEYIAARKRPMIVSTGMSTLSEIEAAVEAITRTGNSSLVLLHCVVSYPASPADANLKAIDTLKSAFGFPVGLSDHTQHELTSVLATQMGAAVIEKHFTLDHALKLPDDEASLDPKEFALLVERVRLVPKAMGDGVKRVLETEKNWRLAARKSLCAARDISAGETITSDMLTAKRPSNGIHPHHMPLVVGGRATRKIDSGAPISWDMLAR
jgi:N,N'-diacetyllegionaminate synthase